MPNKEKTFSKSELLAVASPDTGGDDKIRFGSAINRWVERGALKVSNADDGARKHRRYDVGQAMIAAIGLYFYNLGFTPENIEALFAQLQTELDQPSPGLEDALMSNVVSCPTEFTYYPSAGHWHVETEQRDFGRAFRGGMEPAQIIIDLVPRFAKLRAALEE